MAEKVDKKRIATNTIFLYIRMFVSMAVGLFTSRITLEYLGITDYGIYQTVGGIVGMVSFVNTAISTGISRFITFGIGEGNPERLRRLFSTLLSSQLVFIIALVMVAETLGLWWVKNKLIIPADQMKPALYAYHLSVLTMALSMVANPFTAMIVAHERMKMFAYVSLVNSFAVLGASYLLTVVSSGRLYLYATELFLISAGSLIFHIWYSKKNFSETNFNIIFDRKLIREVAGFSGWSLFAALSIALNSQGILVLLNMFFSPAVVSARALSLTVNSSANAFVSNFRNAMNPQIVKQYAAGNHTESKRLLLASTQFSFYLMLFLCVPIFYMAGPLLSLWLKQVPDYTEIFLKIVIIQSLFQIFDTSFYTALYAKGRLRENALISPTIGFIAFPIVYFLFRNGSSPVALSWVMLFTYIILGVIIKPILLVKIVKYNWEEILKVVWRCILVGSLAFVSCFPIFHFAKINGFIGICIGSILSILITGAIIYLVGLSSEMRHIFLEKARMILISRLVKPS